METPLVIIMGPTASGKTALSLELAEEFNGEIISADSRQIYFGLNIGTEKVAAREKIATRYDEPILFNYIPHYLIDIINPDQFYSAGDFQRDARQIATKIKNFNKIPFVVGGTGFYVRALTGETSLSTIPPDPVFRAWAEKQPLNELTKELTERDPKTVNKIDLFNPRRVIRALEIARNPSLASQKTLKNDGQKIVKIAINRLSNDLKKIIEKRIDSQLERGLVEEVQKLREKYGENAPGLRTISYQELFPFLNGKMSLEQARQDIINASWHYAKRQMTWLRKEPGLVWIKTSSEARKILREQI